ncbi:lytic transglycosylase domain-containing protein [Parasphingorhabdus cellanae]|uniref:Lytic transglycosylase domain-containing protein n=1 Tax=Parasphingorhabdus cellanae TaxID=2806553 RepID=A0ABX7T6J3_9SPHN|nr:lytic transglycosylase domain-containing protein [Parasphingorhabdus cellanae]QTD56132.1 lytic transglycosylase domain-containing protein [Parasphingorhabdus cellanae]
MAPILLPTYLFPIAAHAQQISVGDSEQFASELMFNCPTDGAIRVADASSVSRFQSLKGCSEKTIIAPPETIMRPVAPVRIESNSDVDSRFDNQRSRNVSQAKRAKQKTETRSEPQYHHAVIRPRPIGKDEQLIHRIAPDIQEISAWEEMATTTAPIGAVAGQSLDNDILTLRPRSYSTRHDALISEIALRYAIDPLLLHAVIKQESGYRASIRSQAGAVGLMQIMPGTGQMLGVPRARLTDPASNVDAGARHLRDLHAKYDGDFDLVLAAYNAGEGAVSKYGNRIPPYKETQNYVRSVKAHYVRLIGENGYQGVQF